MDDERFKHIATDPRFKKLRLKKRKVEVDERFHAMFDDKKFTMKTDKDKRGMKIRNPEENLRKYYYKKESVKKTEAKEEKESEKGVSDCEDKLAENEESIADSQNLESGSEVSSSSDESDSEPELDIDERIIYDWTELDQDAETIDKPTKRIAMQNFDWTHITANDVYTICNSIRRPIKACVYISEFGKERLLREEREGPPELVDMPVLDEDEIEYKDMKNKLDNLKNHKRVDEDEEDADIQSFAVKERIRRYELNKLKYYYAVVEFDSIESAQAVYKELDGIEYEGSSILLDLRYVPDDMNFDEADMKTKCDTLPDVIAYEAPQFISTALQQTKVDFSWDTDKKRQEKLRKSYSKDELENNNNLQDYLASDSESELDDDEQRQLSSNKYAELMKSINEEEERKNNKVDIECNFDSDQRDSDSDKESSVHDEYKKLTEIESVKKMKTKNKKKNGKRKKGNLNEQGDELESKSNEELDLLVDEVSKKTNFKFDAEDDRFKAIYENTQFNIDPSHPKFKFTPAFEQIANKKRRLRQERN